MNASKQCLDLIKEFEGLRLKAYFCPAGIPTIGWGTTRGVTAEDVRSGRSITKDEAQAFLERDVHEVTVAVLNACLKAPSQGQLDAMVSLTYNIGIAGFKRSTVLRAHNKGDESAASRAFGLWNKATVDGVLIVMPGLVRRRASEADMYLRGSMMDLGVRAIGMPQKVEPETQMSQSTINGAATVTGGVAAAGAVTQVISAANDIKSGLEGLGTWVVPLLLITVVGLMVYIVLERNKQRDGGWA